MNIFDLFLWPGTKICQRMGIDPEKDAGLIRWMLNTLIYLSLSLAIMWAILA